MMKAYRKKGTQDMTPWVPGFDMIEVSVSAPDTEAGSPQTGDMIAVSASNPDDKWLVAKAFFEENYEEA